MLSSEIELLMYSTFAVQLGEDARQQRLAPRAALYPPVEHSVDSPSKSARQPGD